MDNIAKEKAMRFAVRIVNLKRFLNREKREFQISEQILRSGTSIGANIAEAECALSEKDFLAKIYIALKESAETLFWIELLYRSQYITEKQFHSLYDECMELKKILAATTISVRKKHKPSVSDL